LRTICLVWLRTMILLISAFWVGKITGVSPQHPASFYLFNSHIMIIHIYGVRTSFYFSHGPIRTSFQKQRMIDWKTGPGNFGKM
jgi:hypothetical protein